MTDKYVAVNDCFDECFKSQVGQYPDNDKSMSKDYHLPGQVIHAILFCTQKCLLKQGFVFTFNSKFVDACEAKTVAEVKASIASITKASAKQTRAKKLKVATNKKSAKQKRKKPKRR